MTITLWTKAIDGTSTAASDGTPAAPALIHGWLSGTVGGSDPAPLSMMFDQGLQPDDPRFYQPHPLPPFPAGSSFGAMGGGRAPGYLGFNHGESFLALDATGKMTPVAGQLDLATPTPEPTSVMTFLVGAVSIGLAQWRRSQN